MLIKGYCFQLAPQYNGVNYNQVKQRLSNRSYKAIFCEGDSRGNIIDAVTASVVAQCRLKPHEVPGFKHKFDLS